MGSYAWLGRVALILAVTAGSGMVAASPAGAGVPPPAGASHCPQDFGTYSSDAARLPGACWRPYADPTPSEPSPFNTLIPSGSASNEINTAVTSYLARSDWSLDLSISPDVDDQYGSRPVYWAAAGDPTVTVTCDGFANGVCQRGRPGENVGFRPPIPRGAQPEAASDGHLTVVDQGDDTEYDFWQFQWTGECVADVPAPCASSASAIPIGNGVGNGRNGAAENGNLGLLGGILRAPELWAATLDGQPIDHALAVTVPCVQLTDVYPSNPRQVGDVVCGDGGGPAEGALLALKPAVERAVERRGLPAWERAIVVALARYGAYVVDTSGDQGTMQLVKEDDLSYTAIHHDPPPGTQDYRDFVAAWTGSRDPGATLAGITLNSSDFQALDPCVPAEDCAAASVDLDPVASPVWWGGSDTGLWQWWEGNGMAR